MIPGWIEALPMMPKGSKWQLVIPANLAYGDKAHGKIPPASPLIFEIELLDSKPSLGAQNPKPALPIKMMEKP
jgi:FKBP-type peptidyl-prolyl cis-trans isomerase